MKEDKIFNNRYNTGDIEYETFGAIKVHDKYIPRDTFEEYTDNRLQEDLYEVFQTSDFYDNLRNSKGIPPVEKFVAVAEFMSISYDLLYEELAPVYKEALLKELDVKYNIFKKKNIKRLF
jgi:hypothetical protein